jgi:hypothetical protein
MEVSRVDRRWQGHRRALRFRRQRRAVVSVVGTLLSLLVFFALFGIFVTQYVPIWMSDNEAVETSSLQAAFASLKQNIDLQTALGQPASLSTAFTLTSQGIPLIAQPTQATMNYVPRTQGVYLNVSLQWGPGGKPNFSTNVSLGTVHVAVPNRFYPAQQFEFENDGVIESQGDTRQVMLYPPPLTINVTGNHTSVDLSELQLYGNATQIVSTGTVQVFSQVSSIQNYDSNGSGLGGVPPAGTPFRASITIGTLYPCAWATYLNATMAATGLLRGANYSLTPSTCVPSNGVSTPVELTLFGVNSFDLVLASFVIEIGVGHS